MRDVVRGADDDETQQITATTKRILFVITLYYFTYQARRCSELGVVALVAVLLVVKLFGLLAGVTLGLFAVEEVEALGFEELVDLTAGDAGEDLLGHLVLGVLATGFLALLVFAHRHETGSEADGFVRELGLVLLRVLVVC